MNRSLIVAVATLAALSACSLLPGGETEIDGDWVLVAGTHDEAPIDLPADARVTLTIDGTQIGGIAACNHYGGELERDGDAISIGVLAVTEMACQEPLMSLESAYLDALPAVETARGNGDRLTLSGPGVELVFTAVAAVPDAELRGTQWMVESLLSGDAVASTVADGWIVFAEDGSMTGSTGCRSISGRYEVDGAMLRFSDLAADMRGCTGALDDQDRHVIGVLEGQPTLTLDGDRLTLDVGDSGLVYRATGE